MLEFRRQNRWKEHHCHLINPNKKVNPRKRKKMALNNKLFPVDNRLEAQQTIALLDTGSTASFVHSGLVQKKLWRKCSLISFDTKGG
eukprot:9984111-Ditylum_brightwellii.AAC.1